MGKLHELLAVESDLEKTMTAMMEEGKNTLSKKAEHFISVHKEYTPTEDDGLKLPTEYRNMVTTVDKKLAYVFESIEKYINVIASLETTNQVAKADIVIDGVEIAKDVPAMFLLGMERRLKKWRELILTVPTLPPGVPVEEDRNEGEGVWVTKTPTESYKTRKEVKSKILVPAQFPKAGEGGQSLPAQISEWNENVVIGKWNERKWFGMWTPAKKAEVLGRIEKLMRAVKKARQRANSVEIIETNIASSFINYVMKG